MAKVSVYPTEFLHLLKPTLLLGCIVHWPSITEILTPNLSSDWSFRSYQFFFWQFLQRNTRTHSHIPMQIWLIDWLGEEKEIGEDLFRWFSGIRSSIDISIDKKNTNYLQSTVYGCFFGLICHAFWLWFNSVLFCSSFSQCWRIFLAI